MAHEDLKFKIDLTNFKDYQPILGSQDYGTFYMIYMKIISYEKYTNADGFEQHRYQFEFKIQNFIGAITIGLKKCQPELIPVLDQNPNDPVNFQLKLAITPFSTKKAVKYTEVLDQPIKPEHILSTQYRRNIPGCDLYDENDFDDSRYLNPYQVVRDGDEYLKVCLKKEDDDDCVDMNDMGGETGFCVPSRSVFY